MKVSVITSAYNRVGDLINCIDSIRKSTYDDYEIIVVDNASTDETSRILNEKYGEQIKLITLTENVFSAGGKNAGIAAAKGEYLWFVDSDMLVTNRLMEQFVRTLDENKTIGLVGSKIYYYEDKEKLWSCGATINMITSMAKSKKQSELHGKISEVDIILCGYMVRREVIEKVGGFDERLKIVFEESDFEKRIQLAGYKIKILNDEKIYHNVELPDKITNPLRKYNLDNADRAFCLARNRSIYMKRYARWYGKISYFILWVHIFCMYYVWKAYTFKRKDLMKAYLKGYWAGFWEKK